MSQGFDEVSCTNVTCRGKKKWSRGKKKVLEQHSVGSRGGRVEAVFDVFFLYAASFLTFLLQKQIDSFALLHHT